MKKEKLNGAVLEMRLNADNRNAFKRVILADAFQKRSDDIRGAMQELIDKLVALSWGKTPQAAAANRKAHDKLLADSKRLEQKGIYVNCKVGRTDYDINLNFGGLAILLYFKKPQKHPIIGFNDEFLSYSSGEKQNRELGADDLTLPTDHKLAKQFFALKEEAEAITEAAEELTAVLNTIFGKSRTLGNAVEKWPELSMYAPSILSASRELMVCTPDLNARIDALRSGEGDVKSAMKKRAKGGK